MAEATHKISKKRDRTNENFQRAVKNVMRRCDEINRRYQADVYTLFYRNHRLYEYTSTDQPSWPKPTEEIVSRITCFCVTNTEQSIEKGLSTACQKKSRRFYAAGTKEGKET